jgi:hypothetical protein
VCGSEGMLGRRGDAPGGLRGPHNRDCGRAAQATERHHVDGVARVVI